MVEQQDKLIAEIKKNTCFLDNAFFSKWAVKKEAIIRYSDSSSWSWFREFKESKKILKALSPPSQHIILGYDECIKDELISLSLLSEQAGMFKSKSLNKFYKSPLMALTKQGLKPFDIDDELADVIAKPSLSLKYRKGNVRIEECLEQLDKEVMQAQLKLNNAEKHSQKIRISAQRRKIKYLKDAIYYIKSIDFPEKCYIKKLSQIRSQLHLFSPESLERTVYNVTRPFDGMCFPLEPYYYNGYSNKAWKTIDWPSKLVMKPIITKKYLNFEPRDIKFVGDLSFTINSPTDLYFPFFQVNNFIFISHVSEKINLKSCCPPRFKPFVKYQGGVDSYYPNPRTSYWEI